MLGDLVEERCAGSLDVVHDGAGSGAQVLGVVSFGESGPGLDAAPRQERDGRRANGRSASIAIEGARLEPGPHEAARATVLVQPFGLVLGDARGQDVRLPRARRGFVALELSEHGRHGIRSLHARIGQHPLPLEQKTQEIPGRDGLDLGSQALDGVAMNAREQTPLAPLFLDGIRREPAAHRKSLALQGGERGENRSGRQSDRVRDDARAHRTDALEPPADDLDECFIRGGKVRLEQSAPLDRHPQRPSRAVGEPRDAPLRLELAQELRPCGIAAALLLRQERQPRERIVQLVERRRVGPCLAAHALDRVGIELAEVRRGGRVDPAPAHHRLRPALLERRIVEVGVGTRVQRLEGERRGLGEVARDDADPAAARARAAAPRTHRCPSHPRDSRGWSGEPADGPESRSRPVKFSAHATWSGNTEASRSSSLHARDLRRNFLAAAKPRQGERDARVPAPAHLEHRRGAQRLHQDVPHRARLQIAGTPRQARSCARG